MSVIKMNSTALVGTNKTGILKPNADGYYEMFLGALQYPNSYGAEYAVEPARQILNGDSIFTRRLRAGRLVGELGHPTPYGMTDQQFATRLTQIDEKNESHHIRSIVIDTTAKDAHGRPVIAFKGEVKPSGPYGNVLREKFNDKDQNVCFSIRSFTRDSYQSGKLVKNLLAIVTFDYVHEPGINVADKYNAPSLESAKDYYSVELKPEVIDSLIASKNKYGLESSGSMDVFKEIKKNMGKSEIKITPPQFDNAPSWSRQW